MFSVYYKHNCDTIMHMHVRSILLCAFAARHNYAHLLPVHSGLVSGPLLCIATAVHYCDVMSHLLCLLLQFVGEPVGYVQQIVVKSTVSPWDSQRLIQTDAFRAPLATAFSLLEHINSFKLVRGYAVGHCCRILPLLVAVRKCAC